MKFEPKSTLSDTFIFYFERCSALFSDSYINIVGEIFLREFSVHFCKHATRHREHCKKIIDVTARKFNQTMLTKNKDAGKSVFSELLNCPITAEECHLSLVYTGFRVHSDRFLILYVPNGLKTTILQKLPVLNQRLKTS